SLYYFRFIEKLMEHSFDLSRMDQNAENQLYGLMLYYDFYAGESEHTTLQQAIKAIGNNKDFVNEMRQFVQIKVDLVFFEEFPCVNLGFPFPLHIHARYTREQVLVAMGLSTFEKKSSNREGVALNKQRNTEALFINLKKSEEDFSPTT